MLYHFIPGFSLPGSAVNSGLLREELQKLRRSQSDGAPGCLRLCWSIRHLRTGPDSTMVHAKGNRKDDFRMIWGWAEDDLLRILWQFLDGFGLIFGPEAMNMQLTTARISKRHQKGIKSIGLERKKMGLSEVRYPLKQSPFSDTATSAAFL